MSKLILSGDRGRLCDLLSDLGKQGRLEALDVDLIEDDRPLSPSWLSWKCIQELLGEAYHNLLADLNGSRRPYQSATIDTVRAALKELRLIADVQCRGGIH